MPTAPVDDLVALLDLQVVAPDRFRGSSPKTGWQRVFGGQVIAQAIVAASRTVDTDRPIHSLHAYFLLPGDPAVPIDYSVQRLREGGSFTTRQVAARQKDRTILTLAASFQAPEDGLEHRIPMPAVPRPEDLPSDAEMAAMIAASAPEPIRRYWTRPRPLVFRPVDVAGWVERPPSEPARSIWVRTSGPLPDDPSLHRAVLAYLSDMTLLDTALIVHGRSVFDPDLQVASLDHAMWFHRPPKPDAWLLYVQDSPSSSGGRGFTRGGLFDEDGVLVASVAQEGLIRRRRRN